MLALDTLPKFSDTSVNAEGTSAQWCHLSVPQSGLHSSDSREFLQRTLSNSSLIRVLNTSAFFRFKEFLWWDILDRFTKLNMLTHDTDCLTTVTNSKHYFRDTEPLVHRLWATAVRKEETPSFDEDVKELEPYDEDTRFQGFRNCPPAAPVIVLKRNVKGVWTKFNDAADEEEQMPHLPPPAQTSYMVTEASDATGTSRGPRRCAQRLLRSKDFQLESSSKTRPAKRRMRSSDRSMWSGSMRALRDAHVRLVLRQLRHVERLNRALDHSARAPARLNIL